VTLFVACEILENVVRLVHGFLLSLDRSSFGFALESVDRENET